MTAVIWNSNRIARTVLVLTGLASAAPAMAEEVNPVAIYGEVAPRCWVAEPMKMVVSNGAVQATSGRAICNQARPLLASQVRMIGSDGVMIKRVPLTADRAVPVSARTALEIVVTPQL